MLELLMVLEIIHHQKKNLNKKIVINLIINKNKMILKHFVDMKFYMNIQKCYKRRKDNQNHKFKMIQNAFLNHN